MAIRRIYVEKKPGFNIEGSHLLEDLKENIGIPGLKGLRILHRYDVANISDAAYEKALTTIFSEPPVDTLREETFDMTADEVAFAIEYLPGQYDQRADSCEQCIQIINGDGKPTVLSAKIIVLKGGLSQGDIQAIKHYCINPVDSREAAMAKPTTLALDHTAPDKVAIIEGFIDLDEAGIEELWQDLGLAMTVKDLHHTQRYFKSEEKRDPSITEIRVLDTYWSDHCRHTTFLTKINSVTFEEGEGTDLIKGTYDTYLKDRVTAMGEAKAEAKDVCLMDIALLAMRKLRKEGKLEDLEISDEINACSIIVPVDVDGKEVPWLVMFKNETHNHPTEIEPFGGAATCLGGAIRDPLSGRAYVYQAMRVTGAADPRKPVAETMAGKLPQRKIVTESAHGYSAYGNQIGLATGKVAEIYHPNYVAKRMEIGAVIAAAPRENVLRETADPGDIIVLLGGRTGRDGCGGATGSSKAHTESSIHTCGAEVQKGNPPTERKIQRLFRNPKVAKMIKKCNDFGAGGVSVAIGELADGLIIHLDQVPKKYAGLDGTELAISESQERMAVVLNPKDVEAFIAQCDRENLEAVAVADVTEEKRLIMTWAGNTIVDMSRAFVDTNGAVAETDIHVLGVEERSYFDKEQGKAEAAITSEGLEATWLSKLSDLNVCGQKGLEERFDSSVGAGSVLMPYGGRYQMTPTQSMVAKIPMVQGETTTGTIMAHGYNPYLTTWSPYHGAIYAIVDAVAKTVATGGDWKGIRFTFQEYFKRLGGDSARWGEPFSALLGAYHAQSALGLPAIGGKDSMSGTFNDIDVPPTLVAFAVDVCDVSKVISPEFKAPGHEVVCLALKRDDKAMPDFHQLKANYDRVYEGIQTGKIISAYAVGFGGVAEAVTKMAFGNRIGVRLDIEGAQLFSPDYGSLILELAEGAEIPGAQVIGTTTDKALITAGDMALTMTKAMEAWESPLKDVFPITTEAGGGPVKDTVKSYEDIHICSHKVAKPRVFIPVFPGTNCEYDSARAFERAGAKVSSTVFSNRTPDHIQASLEAMAKEIRSSQILLLPGGFSAGDEPEGSGKFIASIFRNDLLTEAVHELLQARDGLMIGICNGFQALIKLGLLPEGHITDLKEGAPTLTYNTIGRHISCMADTKVMSNKSPWLRGVATGEIFTQPLSHGEGRFVASEAVVKALFEQGQIATTYVDPAGNPTMDGRYNPNGSVYAIEGITSPDGRVLGKMGHSERIGTNIAKNISGNQDMKIFESGVTYFK